MTRDEWCCLNCQWKDMCSAEGQDMDLHKCCANFRLKKDATLYPLRLDQRTVIYVTKDKLTPEYAEKKRKQFGVVRPVEKKGGNTRVHVNVEDVRALVRGGMYLKDIAKRLGVSKTTIDNYIKKYNLRDEDK